MYRCDINLFIFALPSIDLWQEQCLLLYIGRQYKILNCINLKNKYWLLLQYDKANSTYKKVPQEKLNLLINKIEEERKHGLPHVNYSVECLPIVIVHVFRKEAVYQPTVLQLN